MTERYEAALQTMELLTSAKAAERIGRALGYGASASTLLRCAHRYQPPALPAGEIGVDDFAFRRGRSYGTIIVDLATNQPIELLSERSVESLTAYLEAHPMGRVVARDRDAAYAEARAIHPTAKRAKNAHQRPRRHSRYNTRSTIITSQLPPDAWHDYLSDPTLADAILDRFIHNVHQLRIPGDSLRKTRSPLTPPTTASDT